MDIEGRRFVSVKAAALYLSVHPMTIRSWINEGRIPAARIGRAIRVDLRALDRQLDEGRVAPIADGRRGTKR